MNDLNDPRLPAVERLALSRERLRGALRDIGAPPTPSHDQGPSVLMTALLAIPGLNVVVESVRAWWAQHPLHLATLVAGNTARSAMDPMAKRSPFGLILAAAAVGGLLYWIKPWRGLLKPALLAGLVPHFVSRAMEHVPVESWINAVTTFASERMRGNGAASAATQEAAGPGTTASQQPAAASTASATRGTTSSSDPTGPTSGPGTLH